MSTRTLACTCTCVHACLCARTLHTVVRAVCMCACVRVCRVRACVHAHVSCVRVSTFVHACVHACVRAYRLTRVRACVRVRVVCVRAYTHAHVHVCVQGKFFYQSERALSNELSRPGPASISDILIWPTRSGYHFDTSLRKKP